MICPLWMCVVHTRVCKLHWCEEFFSSLHCHHSTQITRRTSHNFSQQHFKLHYTSLFHLSFAIPCHKFIILVSNFSSIYFFHVFVFTKLSFNLLLVYVRRRSFVCAYEKFVKQFFLVAKTETFLPSNHFQLKWLFRTTEIKIKWPRRNEKWTGKRARVECISMLTRAR